MSLSPWRDTTDPDPSWMHEIKAHTVLDGLRLLIWGMWMVFMLAVGLNALYHPTGTTHRPLLLPCGVLHLLAPAEYQCTQGIQGFLQPPYPASPQSS